ncbi:hypothetical protein MMC22_001324 [Lobaria immixta]|nr:hypothetical protein [Lobaria immixta]
MTTPDTQKPLNVAICGGGIAGLCLAIGLLRQKVPFHIYESASTFAEVGAGVAFGPNALRAMDLLDPKIKEGCDRQATKNLSEDKKDTWFTFVMGMDGRAARAGESLFGVSLGGLERSTVHRAAFLDELVKLVPKEMVSFGKKVVDVVEREEGVTLKFACGDEADASAVVGCDGIRSRVRAVLLGQNNKAAKPEFTGKYAYRGLIPMNKAKELLGHELATNSTMHLGYNGHVLTFPIERGQTLNVVACRTKAERKWEDSRWVVPVERKKMEEDFENWGENVKEILSLMEKPDVWALFDYPPADRYYRGRVCMMGDAAHASTPHQGAGAGMAIEDALILSNLLGSLQRSSDIEAAFRAFDMVQRPRTQKLTITSRAAGELYELQDERVGDDLEALQRDISSRLRWIWNQDLDAQVVEAMEVLRTSVTQVK